MRWSLLFLVASLFVLSCSVEEPAVSQTPLATESAAIVGGSREYGWQAVGALVADYDYYGYHGSFCTATLIDSEWVLTAAHCLTGDGRNPAPSTDETYFYIGNDARPTDWGDRPDGEFYAAERFYVHPQWDDDTTTNDIALVKLARSVTGVTPLGYNASPFSSSMQGEPVFYVGFGVTDGVDMDDGGIKRSANINLHMYYDQYYVGRFDGTGVCFGDSGGPGLYQYGDQWLVVGVNSSVASNDRQGDPCEGWYYHTRVDHYAPWVAQYVAGVTPDCNDSPSMCRCGEACQADGTCDDSVCPTIDCADVMDCMYGCPEGDSACQTTCLEQGSNTAQQQVEDMYTCFENSCSSYAGDAWQSCVYNNCGDEITACWPPADCDILGGDCEPGEACYPAQSGANDCYTSDGLGLGQSCDPDISDRLACADGLICLTVGEESNCYAFCLSQDDCPTGEGCDAPVFSGVGNVGVCQCTDYDNDGYCQEDDDCNDHSAAVHPGAAENCSDSLDNDCDGDTDGDDSECAGGCTDADRDGHCAETNDCDDANNAVYLGAEEACDSLDNDCDGLTDEDCATCTDADQDGVCLPEDCDDRDRQTHPGAVEACFDEIDNDCDGLTDENCAGCVDADEDGYCADVDCNDGNAAIRPEGRDLCGDGVDGDCDGLTDEGCDTPCVDADEDGYCADVDCNDKNPAIHPDGNDMCGDGVDGDCDGVVDQDCPEACVDWDHDGYCDFAECDDANSAVSPAHDEVCDDGIDNDCDGAVDEGCSSGNGNDSDGDSDEEGSSGCSPVDKPGSGLPLLLFLLLGAAGLLRRRLRPAECAHSRPDAPRPYLLL